MKKTLLIAGVALTSLQGAEAASKSFDGFYLGAQAALNSSKTKSSVTNEAVTSFITTNGGSASGHKRATGFLYGLYAGYGKNLNGFYVGGEFSIAGDSTTRKANGAGVTYKNTSNITVAINDLGEYKRGIILGVAPRFGYVFGENLVYIKTGFEISRDKVKMTMTSTTNQATVVQPTLSANKTCVVFTPGVGYERAMGNLLLRIEYTYNVGNKINVNQNVQPITGWGQVSYSDNRFAFGVACKI